MKLQERHRDRLVHSTTTGSKGTHAMGSHPFPAPDQNNGS
jgi:hypothetical protein